MRIKDIELYTVKENIYVQLLKLNLGYNGNMRHSLKRCLKNSDFARVIYLYTPNGKVLSWCLMFEEDEDDDDHNLTDLYFYTKRTYRKRGYATRILKFILKKYHPEKFNIFSDSLYRKITNKKYKKILINY